jgi:hypothetical protein
MQTNAPPADWYSGWTLDAEPHAARKAAILKKYPEVTKLYGHDPSSKWWVMLSVVAQLYTAYLLRDKSWWILLPVAYIWGATINHSLQLTAHELCHNLFFANPTHNLLFGFVANMPIPPAMMVYVQISRRRARQAERSQAPRLAIGGSRPAWPKRGFSVEERGERREAQQGAPPRRYEAEKHEETHATSLRSHVLSTTHMTTALPSPCHSRWKRSLLPRGGSSSSLRFQPKPGVHAPFAKPAFPASYALL